MRHENGEKKGVVRVTLPLLALAGGVALAGVTIALAFTNPTSIVYY